MQISFGGINTGLPPNLVDQIVEAESLPIRNLQDKNKKIETKLSLVQTLENDIRAIQKSLQELAGTGGFRDIKLLSSDPGIVTGTVDPVNGPSRGSYAIEVVELAQKASAMSNGFPDKDRTEVGIGYLAFETESGTKEVYVDGNNNTLEGVAKAINAAGIGMRASIIQDRSDEDNPFRLVLAGETVGSDGKVEYPTVYFLDGDQDFYFDDERGAKNGRVKIDGFEVEIASNTITDLIPGVTLDLKNAQPGKTVTLDVKEDMEVVSGKIEEFVSAINKVLVFIQAQSRMDANTDTSKTLGGDSLIRSVANRFRQILQGTQVGVGEIQRLNQIGIFYNREGTLDFEKEKFNDALSKNPDAVESFFAGDGFVTGFIPSLRNMTKTLLEPAFGIIGNRKRGFQQRIDQANDQIERKETQLARREETLRRKFSKLEETMSRLKGQGGQLAALGAGTGGGLNLGGVSQQG